MWRQKGAINYSTTCTDHPYDRCCRPTNHPPRALVLAARASPRWPTRVGARRCDTLQRYDVTWVLGEHTQGPVTALVGRLDPQELKDIHR
eukprot:242830-Pleurochrysis_carterae.AAC.2